MAEDKRFQARPESKKTNRRLKSVGLVLLIASSILLSETDGFYTVTDAVSTHTVKLAEQTDTAIVSQQFSLEEYTILENQQSEQPRQDALNNQRMLYRLACFESDSPYTYDLLVGDITETLQCYQDIVTYDVIGKSVSGKDIYAVMIGHGATHILITAGVHARETANTPLIMQCLFDFLYAYDCHQYADVLDRATLVIVPLVNPDGYQYCIENADARKKTNMNLVDINRNFPCKYWGAKKAKPGNGYPGLYAGSEPETKAIMALFDEYTFSLAVDIHSRGRQIICQKGGYTSEDIAAHRDPDVLNRVSLSIAELLLEDINYDRIKELKVVKGAEGTLTDYAFTRGVPTITFETLRYRKYQLPSALEIQKEYAYFDWPEALYKIAEFAVDIGE